MLMMYRRVASMICLALATTGIAAMAQEPQSKLWCEFAGQSGPGVGKHIVLIAGDDEYRSEEALPMLGRLLAQRFGFRCSVLFPINEQGIIQPDYQENIPGMQMIENADLLVLGLRFRNLPDEQMGALEKYLQAGKPLIGLRTSTHAFRIPVDRRYVRYSFDFVGEGWEGGFGQRVLGDTWVSHHGDHSRESTRGIVNLEHENHPILKGVRDIWGPTDVYSIIHLPVEANVLLYGEVVAGMTPDAGAVEGKKNDPRMPLAWTRMYSHQSGCSARVFCTTLGAATDFQSAGLRRLFVNACFWCLAMEDKIDSASDVSPVTEYKPSDFGFGGYRKNLTPSDYQSAAGG